MSEGRWSRLLLPEALVTVPVFLVSLAWLALGNFLDVENFGGLGGPLQRGVLLLLVQVVAFSVPALVYVGLRRRLSPDALVAVLLVAVVLGAAARSVVLYRGLELISGRTLIESPLRTVTSLGNVVLALVIVWAGYSVVVGHRRTRQRLLEEQDQVMRLRGEARQDLRVLDVASAEQIRAALLAEIEYRGEAGAAGFSTSLRRLIEDVVRPLSRYFEQQGAEWLPPDPVPQSSRFDWREAVTEGLRPSRVRPLLIIGILIWVSFPNTLANRGAGIAVISLIDLIVIGIPLMFLARTVARRMSADRGSRTRALAFIAALYASGQLLGLSTLPFMRFQVPHYFYAIATPVYVLIAGALIALAESSVQQTRALDEELRASTAALKWSLARAREVHRVQRRALAHALHGKVQAALASAVLRLDSSDADERARGELAAELALSLQGSISDIDFLHSEAERLDVVLERIRVLWSGIAEIAVTVDDALVTRIAHDPVCAVSVNDLLTELTFNSVKHGSATRIVIDLSCPTPTTLRLAVTDNGRKPILPSDEGLGSALLDDCSIDWHRSRTGGSTHCVVTLPIE